MGWFDNLSDSVGNAWDQFTGVAGADAARRAAEMQAQSAGQANNLLNSAYQTQTAQFDPYAKAGQFGLDAMLKGITSGSFNPEAFHVDMGQDPGYKFRMDRGTAAINQGAAARGNALSGGTLAALAKFGQGLGSQEYGAAYGRASDAYNRSAQLGQQNYSRLSGLAGLGQWGAGNIANAAGQNASAQGANLMDAANARAAGEVGAQQQRNQGWGNIASLAGKAYGAYSSPGGMLSFLPGGGGPGGGSSQNQAVWG
jgi:hypothetical protein